MPLVCSATAHRTPTVAGVSLRDGECQAGGARAPALGEGASPETPALQVYQEG